MHRETMATAISGRTKKAVWLRDFGRCVLCGSINAGPHCHFIRRSQGGLGIEQNIWTGCDACHRAFDSESTGGPLHERVRDYLRTQYQDWDESKLIYQKHDPGPSGVVK